MEKINIIESELLEKSGLTDKENEIAQKILNDLSGTLIFRAISILDFCSKLIGENASQRLTRGECTHNQMREEFGLNPIDHEMANVFFTKVEFDNSQEL